MDRAKAIELLLKEGLDAKPRDWVMGETILVTHKKFTGKTKSGISYMDRLLYLVERDDSWEIYFVTDNKTEEVELFTQALFQVKRYFED